MPVDLDTLTFIYFARVGDYVKIGQSRDYKKRIDNIKTASPFPVEILHVEMNKPEFETAIHRKFAHLRHRGEWFHAHPDLLAYIDKISNELNRSVTKADDASMFSGIFRRYDKAKKRELRP